MISDWNTNHLRPPEITILTPTKKINIWGHLNLTKIKKRRFFIDMGHLKKHRCFWSYVPCLKLFDHLFSNQGEYSLNQSSIYKSAVNCKISLFSQIDNS